jgi:PPOX class probable F420-dependent enzyme
LEPAIAPRNQWPGEARRGDLTGIDAGKGQVGMTHREQRQPGSFDGRPLRRAEAAFVGGARVGHLATVDAGGRPSVVPVCFVLIDDEIVSVLDEKPKRVADSDLRRVRNIEGNPQVALVIDRYDEDWSRLAFVQVRGLARIVHPGDDGHAAAIAALRAKYPQYHGMAIEQRPVIAIGHLTATSWRGDGNRFGEEAG